MSAICTSCGEFWRTGHQCSAEAGALHPLAVGQAADEVAGARQQQADSEATVRELMSLVTHRKENADG